MISKEQFGLWKHEPITRVVFEYLQKKQEFLKASALEAWLSGNPWPEAVRGQIIELEEILNISVEAIEAVNGTESEGSP